MPGKALRGWLELYDQCATEYPGMSARVGTALSDGASAVGTMCGPMKASFARLFQRAQAEVPLRRDLTPALLLSMISALPKDPGSGLTTQPCLQVEEQPPPDAVATRRQAGARRRWVAFDRSLPRKASRHSVADDQLHEAERCGDERAGDRIR